jgi:hypothetical protein
MRPPFFLGLRELLTLAVGLFVVIPLILALTFQNYLYEAYLVQFKAPDLQRELGFRAEYVEAESPNPDAYRHFTITSVQPGGPFWNAGIRPGDIPFGYKHGFRAGFYLDLTSARESGSVELLLVRNAHSDPKAWETPIRVVVRFPFSRGRSAV